MKSTARTCLQRSEKLAVKRPRPAPSSIMRGPSGKCVKSGIKPAPTRATHVPTNPRREHNKMLQRDVSVMRTTWDALPQQKTWGARVAAVRGNSDTSGAQPLTATPPVTGKTATPPRKRHAHHSASTTTHTTRATEKSAAGVRSADPPHPGNRDFPHANPGRNSSHEKK